MHPGKALARVRSPMAKQPVLDVLGLEWFPQEGVVAQIQHAGGEIIARPPLGIHFSDLIGGQRLKMGRHGQGLDVAHDSSFDSICLTCTAIMRSSWAVTTQTST
jgi:hypothetical protein